MTSDFQIKVEREYPLMMRRGDVLEVGKLIGLSERTMRRLIEGEEAAIKMRHIGGQKRGYFDRGRVMEVLMEVGSGKWEVGSGEGRLT